MIKLFSGRKNILVLGLIFALALFLRFYQLNISPPGFNADEAALGYNAYSLLQTGKDEWGDSFPLVFRSFSDYKPGLYIYLDLPFVAVFGLTELSVRLPSLLLGSLSVIFIYLLAKELFKKEIAGLSSAFLLAISPWHIHFSRGAWETNVATFFVLTAVFTFIKGLANFRWFYLSGILFSLAMYTYQSPRIVVPALIILLLVFYFRKLLTKKNIAPLLVTIILLIPLVLIITNSNGWSRFQGISIFTDLGIINRTNELRGEDLGTSSLVIQLYHNKLLAFGRSFIGHYLDHYSPDFLFINGDPLGRNKTPGFGELYLFEIVTLLIGTIRLARNRSPFSRVIFSWLLAAPIASALTYQTPHAIRAHNLIIPLLLVSGLGLANVLEWIYQLNKFWRYFSLGVTVLIIGFFFSDFLHQYFIHLPKEYALEWENGFREALPFISDNQSKYQKVVITDKFDQAYILTLFYTHFDPQQYQLVNKNITDGKFGFSTISSFDKYEFRAVAPEEVINSKNVLYLGTPSEIPLDVTTLKTVFYPNGKAVFKIVGT